MPDGSVVCKRSNEPWPAERVERLRTLLDAGLDYRTIGVALGCSKNAVSGKVTRLGLARAPVPSLDDRLNWGRVVATGCRWIERDPRGDWHWCGARQEIGRPYCAEHMRRARHKAS